MRTIVVAGILWMLASTSVFSQSANKILGTWQSGHGNGRIQMYRHGNTFNGKLIWLKKPNDEAGKPLVDKNNPNDELKSRPIIGIDVLKNLTYKGENVWGGGTIYDPKSGKTYNCQIHLEEPDKIHIRAFFGLALLGKTEVWTKVE